MAMSGPKKLALVGGGAAVLALGIAIPAAAFADPTPTPSSSATDATTPEQRRAEHRDKLAEALAKELGIDQAKVAAALDKVDEQMRAEAKAERQAALKERLAAAVSEGKLTQAEADAILKASEAGVLGGPDGLGGPGRHGLGRGPR
jgi:hypothetical protein